MSNRISRKSARKNSRSRTDMKKLRGKDENDINYEGSPATTQAFWEDTKVVMPHHNSQFSPRPDMGKNMLTRKHIISVSIFFIISIFVPIFFLKSSLLTTYLNWALVFFTGFMALVTCIIAYIASINLQEINKFSHGEFLLRIDERYGEKNILKARMLIHEIYLNTKTECTHSESLC